MKLAKDYKNQSSLFFSRTAKLAGEPSAPVLPDRLLGNGEIAVVDCACVGKP
jgi:hypothetical protein